MGFLTYGVRHLRPLNLRTIADAITMHESTVSRVTSNKYIATPRGVFELKYFFHGIDPVGERLRGAFGGSRTRSHPRDDRERGGSAKFFPTTASFRCSPRTA
ncbi:MAG: hypothetical protein WDM89_09750 [Rhizomicrobium sp.]